MVWCFAKQVGGLKTKLLGPGLWLLLYAAMTTLSIRHFHDRADQQLISGRVRVEAQHDSAQATRLPLYNGTSDAAATSCQSAYRLDETSTWHLQVTRMRCKPSKIRISKRGE